MTQTRGLNISNISKDYFHHVNSPTNVKKVKARKYSLTFKLPFKTEFGESLHIVGSIEELGAWKRY